MFHHVSPLDSKIDMTRFQTEAPVLQTSTTRIATSATAEPRSQTFC